MSGYPVPTTAKNPKVRKAQPEVQSLPPTSQGQGHRKKLTAEKAMADSGSRQTVKYHRRLDRTPEKYFEKLPDSEKKLISAVRDALEGCRKKVDTLKDDLAEK